MEKRPETGLMGFGDDWPGIFIRGDDAMHFNTQLKVLKECIRKGYEIKKGSYLDSVIIDLIDLFSSCIIRGGMEPANLKKLKDWKDCQGEEK
jgi:hypothetical protein